MNKKSLPLAAALSTALLSIGALGGCADPTPPASEAPKSTAANPCAPPPRAANPCAPQPRAEKKEQGAAPPNPCAPKPGGN
ncbi:MAG: hypothetical protein AB7D30_07440 [Lysobacteraceae bacterium]